MAQKSIRISIRHPSQQAGPIQGFRFFWAYYVNGFRPEVHCQKCFKGKLAENFCTNQAESGRDYSLDSIERFPYVYLCGVGSGPRPTLKDKNFHFPLRYEPDASVSKTTYNGYVIAAANAVELPIPALPKGWNNRDEETTRCKNFQFAVAYFGNH